MVRGTMAHPFPCGRAMIVLTAVMASVTTIWLPAADWPTYRHDNARNGITSEALAVPLETCWVYHPIDAPQPAWGDPNPRPVGGWHGLTEQRRVHFDDAYHVVVANGNVYFGSSADGRVLALDVATGQQQWSLLTDGPVRLAPTVWQDKLYVGSDDGYVYCVDCQDGVERWRFQAAPSDRKVLGSGKMISLWPVRTGVLVDAGTAYFGAGIFPAEGVYLYAVDANNGRLIWCNDNGGLTPQSRISPQGYMLASKDRLFVPLGRVSPAAYDRKDGRLIYEAYTEHIIGGTNAVLTEDKLFTGTEQMVGYDQASYRSQDSWFWSHQLIATPDTFYAATGQEIIALQRSGYGAASLQRKKLLDRKRDLAKQIQSAKGGPEKRLAALRSQMDELNQQIAKTESDLRAVQKWRSPCKCDETLVLAGGTLVAGGDGRIVAFDAATGELLWSTGVDGTARGLAVSDGRLFASTDTGSIYCFGAPDMAAVGEISPTVDSHPYQEGAIGDLLASAAEQIVRRTGINRGYCLVLGSGTGRLAYELAKRTELQICCVEPDAELARTSRRRLEAAGLYGNRIVVVQSGFDQVPYADYFANLIVSEDALITGQMPGDGREAFRMLKPLGGKLCIGQPPSAKGKTPGLTEAAIRGWIAAAELPGATISREDGLWLVCERGPLPGAGSWTHQYAEPGNTTCSDDQLVHAPLSVLWFGDPGPKEIADRHRRAAAPLAVNGRLFVLGEGEANRIGIGENAVMAYDAYNGLKLWERKIRGALRVSVTHDSGNSAANDDSLFIAVGDRCIQLDAATGETKQTYHVPPPDDGSPRNWGYVGVVGDVLYGSRTVSGRTADCVFAIDLRSGQELWRREADGISQGAIAISNGRLHFAASSVSPEQRQQAIEQRIKEVHRLSAEQREELLKKLRQAAVYNVVALDAYSGEMLWERPVEVSGAAGGQYWCSLGSICKDDVLVLFGVFLDGHYWTQFFAGQFKSRQVVALSAKDGDTLWRKPIGYRVRPLVVGDTLHAEPWAYDLKTGEQRTRVNPVTGREEPWQFARPGHHCGAPAASPHMLFFRSYSLGWYDLDKDYGTQHFGGQRPGCWINFIPANGLLMMPEASSGCMCPFPNMCSVVFKPGGEERQWAYFSQPGPMIPVKHLAVNLGAPGDRRDSENRLWLGYPRPRGSLVLQYKIGLSLFPGGGYFKHDPAKLTIANTGIPWVFQSGVSGVRECKLHVANVEDGTARYTVRLAFAELECDGPNQRVFDIKIQDKLVADGVDIFALAGGKNRAAVLEFKGIDADEQIAITFAPAPHTKPPVVQGIQIDREQVLTLGFSAPSFSLHNGQRQTTGDAVVVNNRDADFAGTLRIEAPAGVSVSPKQVPLKVASGQRQSISLEVAVGEQTAPGKYPLSFELKGDNGTVEAVRQTVVEHLGNRRRVVLKVVEDASVIQRLPTTNNGTGNGLNVDGGDREMGDHHHGISYLKFRLPKTELPISAALRLYNGDNPSNNSGEIRLVTEPWSERTVTYNTRPKLGKCVAKIGSVAENAIVELPLDLPLDGVRELNLAIYPTSCDGINYISREGGKPAELIFEYGE